MLPKSYHINLGFDTISVAPESKLTKHYLPWIKWPWIKWPYTLELKRLNVSTSIPHCFHDSISTITTHHSRDSVSTTTPHFSYDSVFTTTPTKWNITPLTQRWKELAIFITTCVKESNFRQLKSKKLQGMILSFNFVTSYLCCFLVIR